MIKTDPRLIIDITQDQGLCVPAIEITNRKRIPVNIPRYHWKLDRVDHRDYPYILANNQQPTIVDLRPWCSPVENQHNLGSCTGQAIAGAIEYLHKRTGKHKDISRLFIYYWERYLMGTVNFDSGAYIRDGIKVTNKWGASLETLWPYIVSRFRMRPNEASMRDAIRRTITRYERITDIQGCFDALAEGYPIIMGFSVYSSFESAQTRRTGIMIYPDVRRERYMGGHAVLLVGYDKQRQVFIARNSWGTGWGDRGYFYMPFRVVEDRSMSFDFWTIKGVNNP
jgi:C1A family cysteine protease